MKLKKAKTPTLRRPRLGSPSERLGPSLAYYSRRSDQELNTGRQVTREQRALSGAKFRRFWGQRFGLVILLIVALVCVINVLSLSTDPKIVTLGTGASLLHNQSTYEAAASEVLKSSVFNRNKVTIDTAGVRTRLLQQFPELSDASITLPLLGHRPIVYLQFSALAIIITNSSGSYVIDSTGKALIMERSLASLASLHLPVLTDQSGLKLTLNQQALTSDNVSFVQTVVAQLAAHQVNVASMTLPAAASELDVAIAGQPYFVKFNLQTGDARQQAGTFLATQARLKRQSIIPTKYIDVRLDGRAYYQ